MSDYIVQGWIRLTISSIACVAGGKWRKLIKIDYSCTVHINLYFVVRTTPLFSRHCIFW
jgi:hypothetical protein